jgi:hypothetical protein
MKKTLLFAVLAIIFTFGLSAQQFQNASFENWEDAGTVEYEPVDWSSIKTSDAGDLINNAAPVVWGISDDAHEGVHSVQLTNVLTLGTIIATGTITNGRVHASFNPAEGYVFTDPDDERWNTTLTGRPDSVAVWMKYFPQGNDTAQAKFVLHTGEGTLPATPENQDNWVAYAQINVAGTVDTWTRFSVPFTYFSENNPEYILSILTSGAGLVPIEGSIVRYDDLELIYNPSGIGDIAGTEALIYSSGNTIFLDKLPQNYLNNSTIEILNLSGSTVYTAQITSNRVSLQQHLFTEGLYFVRISGDETGYTQKIYLK